MVDALKLYSHALSCPGYKPSSRSTTPSLRPSGIQSSDSSNTLTHTSNRRSPKRRSSSAELLESRSSSTLSSLLKSGALLGSFLCTGSNSTLPHLLAADSNNF